MKYPYDRFLRFLVSRKVSVNQTLERYGLPRAGDMWIAEYRAQLRKSAPYSIRQYIDSTATTLDFRDDVLEWARSEQIHPLWMMQAEFGSHKVPELDVAFRLFVNPHSRAVFGLLLLSKATQAEMCTVINEQFDVQITDATFGYYKEIFWDISLVNRTFWTPFAENLVSNEERNFIGFGLSSPSIEEVRDLLNLNVSIDHRSICNQIIAKSYLQYKREMEGPRPEEAMKWADLALKAIGTAKQTGAFEPGAAIGVTNTERFRGMFSVEVTKSNHPTLADLAGEIGKREPAKVTGK